jgi:hypothetical protein
MNYIIEHGGKQYEPDGRVDPAVTDIDAKNKATEQEEIAYWQTGPEKISAYVRIPEAWRIFIDYHSLHGVPWHVRHALDKLTPIEYATKQAALDAILTLNTRWSGYSLSYRASSVEKFAQAKVGTWLGGFQTPAWIGQSHHIGFGGSTRRPITCRIFGVLYHGWYYESSGSYCRLKRAKRQVAVKAFETRAN